MERHGFGDAFIDPAPRLQLAAHGRVTDIAGVLGEGMAYEGDRPAGLTIAEGGWDFGPTGSQGGQG